MNKMLYINLIYKLIKQKDKEEVLWVLTYSDSDSPSLYLVCWVILGKLLNPSEFHYSGLLNGDYSTCLIGV